LVKGVVFSPDGVHLASVSHDETARIWNWSREREIPGSPLRHFDPEYQDDKVNDVAYSPDGSWLATAGANFNAVVWDAATGRQLFAGRHRGMVWAVAFSHDGKHLASAGEDGLVRLWEVPSGKLSGCVKAQQEAYGLRRILDVNFSRDGSRLLMATGKGGVYLVDGWRGRIGRQGDGAESAQADEPCRGVVLIQARRLDLHDTGITSADFTLDGKRIITTGKKYQVTLQDAATGKELKEVGVHRRGLVTAVALSPDEFWIATAGSDGSFHVSPLNTEDLWRAVCDRLTRKRLDARECAEYLGVDQCPPPVCDGAAP